MTHADMLADGWVYQEYGRDGLTIAGYTCRSIPCKRHGIKKPVRNGMGTHSGWAEHEDPETARSEARRAAVGGADDC